MVMLALGITTVYKLRGVLNQRWKTEIRARNLTSIQTFPHILRLNS